MKNRFRLRVLGAVLLCGFIPSLSCAAEKNGVVEEWYAHLTVDLMMGSTFSAAAIYKERVPWLFYFYPFLKNLREVPPNGLNPETVISMNPKYVVLPIAYKAQEKIFHNAKIPVAVLTFRNIEGLLETVDQSAQLENTPLAFRRAAQYRAFVTESIGKDFSVQKPSKEAPRVLHLSSLNPLLADGTETIIDEWIRLAGGQNAFTVKGNNRPVTWEQVFTLNPDIVILGEGAGQWQKNTVPQAAFFLPALRSGHLYRNPSGLFLWDRYGVELPLQILWARQVIAGKDPKTPELKEKMKIFYSTFFDLHPSESDLEKILKTERPSR